MSTTPEREAFEAWCCQRWAGDRNALTIRADGEYLNGHVQFAWDAWQSALARAEAERDAMKVALTHASEWIGSAPHGDNCFVSNHYDGDPGNRCNCGKDSATDAIDTALAAQEGSAP